MFSFYSVRPVKFFHPYIKVYVLPTNTVYKVFFNSKGTYHRNRCTFKKNLKSHIFIFYSAPCQISLSLHQSLCFTYSHSLKSLLSPKIPIKEIGALSKII